MLPVLMALSTASLVRETNLNSNSPTASQRSLLLSSSESGAGNPFDPFNGDSDFTLAGSSEEDLGGLVGGEDEHSTGGLTMEALRAHERELEASVDPVAVFKERVAASSSPVARSSARTQQAKPQPAVRKDSTEDVAVVTTASAPVRAGPCDPAAAHFYTLARVDEHGHGTCWELDGKSELQQRVAPKCCTADVCSDFAAPFTYDEGERRCREDRNGNGVGDGFAPNVCCECEAEKPYKWDPDVRGGRCRTDVNRNGKMDVFAADKCCVKPGDAVTLPDSVDSEDEEPTRCTVQEEAARLEGVCVTSAKCEARAAGLRQVTADVCGGKVCCVMQEIDTAMPEAPEAATKDPRQQMLFTTADGRNLKGEEHPFHPVLTGPKYPMVFTFGNRGK